MPTRAILFVSAALVLAMAGCGSSRLSSFPEFPASKARLAKSVILADFLVISASGNDTDVVDLGANKVTADTLLRLVQDTLDARGYNVTNRLLSSVGLLMDSTFTANVSHTSGLDREGEDATMLFHPPFYLYQALRRDPVMTSLLRDLYRKLARMQDGDSGYAPAAEIVPLGKLFGGGMVFIFLGGGYDVSAGLELAAARPPGAETNAKIGYHSISQASLYMFVLDSGTGEVLWTDHQVSRGGRLYNDKFIRMAGILLEDLP
jgi:hypothetical protein